MKTGVVYHLTDTTITSVVVVVATGGHGGKFSSYTTTFWILFEAKEKD